MEKLFLKNKFIELNSLLDLVSEADDFIDAAVYNKNKDGTMSGKVDKSQRSTKVEKGILSDFYPDICKQVLSIVKVWNSSLQVNDYKIGEFQYLRYVKGDHFIKHKDRTQSNKLAGGRLFSTTTLLSKSNDFEGGEFIIYGDDGYPINIDLDIGETIFFDSNTFHEVKPVTKGIRDVLVTWIYKK